MRPDENVQELYQISVKAVKLTKNIAVNICKEILKNSQNPEYFKRHGGKVSHGILNTMGKTELLDADMDKEDLKLLQREFKKYHVNFAVDKDKEDGTFVLYFLSKDVRLIEKAMERVVTKLDKDSPHNQQKKGLNSVKEKEEQVKEKDRMKEKAREKARER